MILAIPYPAIGSVAAERDASSAGGSWWTSQTAELPDVRLPGRPIRFVRDVRAAALLPQSRVLTVSNTNFAARASTGTARPMTTTVLIAGTDAGVDTAARAQQA